MAIKCFSVDYSMSNEQGTFSSGDRLTGRVTLVLSRDITLQSLSVEAIGKAEVKWTEPDGKNVVVYSEKEKYFCLRTLLQEGKGDGSEVVTAGQHVYPFTFHIPAKGMPSSYVGKWGKITYCLEVKLIRTLWQIDEVKKEFPFLSKAVMIIAGLREPQCVSKIVYFASGKISMDIHIEMMGYKPGEAIQVIVQIHNNSTRPVTPNFYLFEKQSFFAKRRRKVYTNDIIKEIGDPVPAGSNQTVTKVLTVPPHIPITFLDCSIIKLEYRLKVSLDVPVAKDPEVKLPLVILLDKSKVAEKRLQEYSWSK
ncbi:hypothetical protein UPYG_G00189200 [Umbra pygmaea]|uniref:Arrestin C-terminal-like domain-containing protein n=1 Tax=Umbra pygmaea TaxID=75934 RepID=A0ABD0WSF9_UMBPY